jgi:hypothetical protein
MTQLEKLKKAYADKHTKGVRNTGLLGFFILVSAPVIGIWCGWEIGLKLFATGLFILVSMVLLSIGMDIILFKRFDLDIQAIRNGTATNEARGYYYQLAEDNGIILDKII